MGGLSPTGAEREDYPQQVDKGRITPDRKKRVLISTDRKTEDYPQQRRALSSTEKRGGIFPNRRRVDIPNRRKRELFFFFFSNRKREDCPQHIKRGRVDPSI